MSIPDAEEAYWVREMIRRVDQVIVLADTSKFGRKLFQNVCGWGSVDILITNNEPDFEMNEVLNRHEINVMVVGSTNDD
ncbi:hypothetical protein PP175_21835 [Aneurinibacillus sp. Ricciae_BoGa-3]|uniref:hypothetical protein n=1 Tax=Aneurinibacillus sp. Ricciae_BoGa-3 TaxID=3022697 RepID=UPI002340CF73|nr:hypothetical protein [Aneurinibacillus sp. Ricciae_BoGa-3]WCK53933.1 hypothetical protein PP175_21835 [Aneurinibacillus sp. Ricciae_BoGa-3]